MCLVNTVTSFRYLIAKNRPKSVLSEKAKLGVGSSIMVSVPMEGHFQRYCTAVKGVA